jgi:GMP synthase-like glutamine amidotransferase
MKIAILETGRPPGDLSGQFGTYPEMFAELLGPEFEVESFDVEAGELPEPASHAAYLITGSPAGVYEPLPWIEPLQQFIRAAKDSRMVGVCFGHQVMAEALGGHVEKSV